MKHVMTCQANTASDWLALAALKCFTEWAGLCAKEGRAHMTQVRHGRPSCYRCAPERTSPTTALFEHVGETGDGCNSFCLSSYNLQKVCGRKLTF